MVGQAPGGCRRGQRVGGQQHLGQQAAGCRQQGSRCKRTAPQKHGHVVGNLSVPLQCTATLHCACGSPEWLAGQGWQAPIGRVEGGVRAKLSLPWLLLPPGARLERAGSSGCQGGRGLAGCWPGGPPTLWQRREAAGWQQQRAVRPKMNAAPVQHSSSPSRQTSPAAQHYGRSRLQ